MSTFSLRDVNAQADMILAQARAEAARILEEARREADARAARTLAEARTRGMADGQREGREQIIREARESVLKATRSRFASLEELLKTLVDTLERQQHALLAEAESGLIELAFAIAQRVCKISAASDARVCAENVRVLLQLVKNQRDVVLRMHPEDVRELSLVTPDLYAQVTALAHVRIVEDNGLARGDSMVTTPDGLIDARIARQLDAIAAAMLSGSLSQGTNQTEVLTGPGQSAPASTDGPHVP